MTPQQIQQLAQRPQEWGTRHADADAETLRAAYRRKVLAFTLNSMALENEPVNAERLLRSADAGVGPDGRHLA
jgi:hypothetical protein